MEQKFLKKRIFNPTSFQVLPENTKFISWLFGILFLIVIASSEATAQGSQQENILRDWQSLYVDQDNLGISYRVVSCNGEIFVMLKMSSLKDQAGKQNFGLRVINISTNESFTRNISVNLGARQQVLTSCGEAAFPELKVAIPRSFDPSNLYVATIF